MSLVVIARNITKLAPISDYDVEVSSNRKQVLFRGLVTGHVRADGAPALLRQIADAMEKAKLW